MQALAEPRHDLGYEGDPESDAERELAWIAASAWGRIANPRDCDEFPYRSTLQGGPGAQIQPISAGDNRKEGLYLGYFYSTRGCDVRTPRYDNATRAFLVLPTPTVHTSMWCNQSKE